MHLQWKCVHFKGLNVEMWSLYFHTDTLNQSWIVCIFVFAVRVQVQMHYQCFVSIQQPFQGAEFTGINVFFMVIRFLNFLWRNEYFHSVWTH